MPGVRRIYFDYNATTPLDSAVREVVAGALDSAWGNPSSIHAFGRDARNQLDDARYRLSGLWKCRPSEVVFTSGGTESNNLALLGTARLKADKGRHLVVSAVEHHSVLHAVGYLRKQEGFKVSEVPVDATGRVDPDAVLAAIRPDTALVSVMAANNEVGTLRPVAAIGRACRDRGVTFHCDAVQAFGKLAFEGMSQFEADLVSVCAHKFHGPKGAGALYIRSPLLPHPIQHGGGHENERRPGTENLPAILGLVTAFERCVMTPCFPEERMRSFTRLLEEAVRGIPGVRLLGDRKGGLANTLAFSVAGADGVTLLANLDLAGVCASSGAACSAGSLEPSHVLRAMGLAESECRALVRLSLGRENTLEEVETVARILPEAIQRARG
jgi:cysteine desulfurase